MTEFLTQNLYGKKVMNRNGEKIGHLMDISIADDNTGEMQSLIVNIADDLHPKIQKQFTQDESGNILVDATSVESVEDYILIDQT